MNKQMSFLIPFRSSNPHRLEAFGFIVSSLQQDWPGCEIIVGNPEGEEFNRSQARNEAAARASGDTLIFIDADSYVPKMQIYAAARSIITSGWAFPYDSYWALNLGSTYRFMRGTSPTVDDTEYIFPSPETPEPSVGGCVVVRRDAFDAVGGWDERFIGWSFEDRAFAAALEIIVGPLERIPGILYHLWHPALEIECFGQPFMEHNRALYHEYLALAAHPEQLSEYLLKR